MTKFSLGISAALFAAAAAVRQLVKAGANVNARATGGGNALHVAVRERDIATVERLLESGVSPSSRR